MACELCEKTADRLEMYRATLNGIVLLLTDKKVFSFEELHSARMQCLAYMDQMEVSTKDELRANLEAAFRELQNEQGDT